MYSNTKDSALSTPFCTLSSGTCGGEGAGEQEGCYRGRESKRVVVVEPRVIGRRRLPARGEAGEAYDRERFAPPPVPHAARTQRRRRRQEQRAAGSRQQAAPARGTHLVLIHQRRQHGEGRAGLCHDGDRHSGAHAVLTLLHLRASSKGEGGETAALQACRRDARAGTHAVLARLHLQRGARAVG